MYDVTALGELLIDFTGNGLSGQGNPLFEANPGGAPCNVLSMLQNLGRSTAFLGKVGNDSFGHTLKKTIEKAGINSAGLKFDAEVPTTLAFVHTSEDGDRDFSFYRNPGADMMLQPEEVAEEIIKESKVFHFGTLSLTDEPAASATRRAVGIAKENGLLISFDPNLRPPLWKNLDMAKEQIVYGLKQCDIVKMSEEELAFVTGLSDVDAGVAAIREFADISLICITLGKQGSIAYYKDVCVEIPGFLQKDTIETTGAGDTFCACMIHGVLQYGIDNLNETLLENILTFANAAASLITTRRGALKVMPKPEEVMVLLKENGKEEDYGF